MKVVTASQMRNMDDITVRELGLPSRILMERAGISVVMAMESVLGDLSCCSYTVLCGKGNNGGDGLVVARTLLDYTDSVTVILIGEPSNENPKLNLDVLRRIGGEILILGKDIDLEEIEAVLLGSDVIVDAMLGIGAKGMLKDPISYIVDMVNTTDAYKVCVDIPTGVDSDTGKILGKAIRCDLTVTFALPKIGHVLYPGREYVGRLKVASIGIPRYILESPDVKREIIASDFVKSLLPKRPPDSNKGTFGRILVISGSKYYTGAPVLTGMGALRTGCGLVYIAVPEPYNTVVTTKFPELIAIPLGNRDGILSSDSLKTLENLGILEKTDVISIGPGLSTGEGVRSLVERVLKIEKPLVLDADGINVLSGNPELLERRNAPTVITPHPGEFSRLTGLSISEVKYNYALAEEFASKYGVVLVLKGATTIVTDGERTFFNTTGNTGLSKGGSGDILTGMIASFMAQGLNALEAAVIAVHIHGYAADITELDQASVTPTDILNNIPKALEDMRI